MADLQDSLGKKFEEGLGSSGIDTNVDIVFVIDATDSMSPVIEMVKKSALSFHSELKRRLGEKQRFVNKLRIKVIWFRDFYYDGDQAYGESKFFELDDERENFESFVGNIKAAGGGDDPESGLEALSMAMRSDFIQEGDKKRHIIILFTDNGAHKLEDFDILSEEAKKKGCMPPVMYPENMPKDLSEFCNCWCSKKTSEYAPSLGVNDRRLILFAPDAYPWTDMETDLTLLIRKSIDMESGGAEIEMEEVYNLIVGSVQ